MQKMVGELFSLLSTFKVKGSNEGDARNLRCVAVCDQNANLRRECIKPVKTLSVAITASVTSKADVSTKVQTRESLAKQQETGCV
jgi:hypothetical protein